MDYCSSCRRHLNGALVCPGCGAYAPDIAPALVDDRPAAASRFTVPDTWHDGRRHHDDRRRDEAVAAVGGGTGEAVAAVGADTGDATWSVVPSADVEGAPAAPQGRAARRRQLARWKRNQRRAVVATAVALVGGGLTVATMDRHSTDRAQAATAPEDPGIDSAEEPTGQYTSPASTQPDAPRSSPTPPEQAPAAGVPRRQAADGPSHSTPPAPRPDATTPVSAEQPSVASPSPEATTPARTGTTSQQTSAPAGTGGTDQGAQQPNPSTATTSPSEVCLLVLCLG